MRSGWRKSVIWCEESFQSSPIYHPFDLSVRYDLTPVIANKLNYQYWLTCSYDGMSFPPVFDIPAVEKPEDVGPAILHRVRCVVCTGRIVVKTRDDASVVLNKPLSEIYCLRCDGIASGRSNKGEEARLLLRYMPTCDYRETLEFRTLVKQVRKIRGRRCQWCLEKDEYRSFPTLCRTAVRRGMEQLGDIMILCPKCMIMMKNHTIPSARTL